jgi:CheY-like chemotaxis protein
VTDFPPVEAPTRDRRSAKSAARAAARRARMANSPTDAVQCEDVLILDDSEIARAFLSRLVRVFGFKPHAVANSIQALDLLERQPFAATFLDVVLADDDDADGLALCQRIKSAPVRLGHNAPAVVMVSGQSQPSDRVRAKLAGCDVFLPKPLSRGDIARALEDCGVPFPADERRR